MITKSLTRQPIGVCAIITNQNGQVLLGKRRNSYKAGLYGLPGGRIEINEPILDAIKREIKEETGIITDNPEYVGIVRENQGDYDFIHFVYILKNVTTTPQLLEPEKCEGWEWFDLDRLPEVLAGHQAGINLAVTKRHIVDLTN